MYIAPFMISEMMMMTRPMAAPIIANIFAFWDASCAPATSPCAHFEFTCAAKMMDTMPRGRQQHSVTTIDCHR